MAVYYHSNGRVGPGFARFMILLAVVLALSHAWATAMVKHRDAEIAAKGGCITPLGDDGAQDELPERPAAHGRR